MPVPIMDNLLWLSRRCRCWNPITPDAPKYPPVARPPCLSLQWTTTGGCPDDVVVGIPPDAPKILPVARPPCLSRQWTTTESRRCRCWNPDRMHQNIRRLQGLRACPYNGQPQGVVPTWVSRRCRCWNPITGCTKISAGCKAPVPVPIMDNHRGVSRRCRCQMWCIDSSH